MQAFHALNSLDPAAQNRALATCIGASLLLHAAALFLLPGMREGGKPAASAQVLSATFAPRTTTPYVPPVPEVKAPPPKPEPPKPQPQPAARAETPRPVLTAPPSSAPSPQVAPAPAVAAPPPPAAPTPPPQAAPAVPAAPSAPAQASAAPPGPASDAADAGSLDKYRMDLIVAARRYKRYPAQAMEKGWQGKVEVRVQIGANGMMKGPPTIKTSSGFAILDQTAVDMIAKGKTLVPIPAALKGKDFVVDVPVIFDLQTG